MSLEALWREKERGVVTLSADQSTVEDAIGAMVKEGVRALIVMDPANQQPVGIFAERDVLRCHLEHPAKPFEKILLADVMTRRLIVAQDSEQVQNAMATMIKADIRHLPIIKDQKIVGMLTISDLVEHLVGSLQAEIHYLQDYIDTLHDAGQD